jgi:integrase
MTARRAYGTGAVTFEHKRGTDCHDGKSHRTCEGRWRGIASQQVDGVRKWVKVDGPTKSVAAEKLREKLDELRSGVRTSSTYTVEHCIEDWLEHGLDGRSERTRELYRDSVKALLEHIGAKPLNKLTAMDVRRALVAIAETRSDRSVQIAHNCLTRAIKLAQANDLVSRNVAALANRPKGKAPGRESKAMPIEVALQLVRRCLAELDATVSGPVSPVTAAYMVLSWTTGMRTEEARALRWPEVDLDAGTVTIIRAARSHGQTKTEGSRRTLELPEVTVAALRTWKKLQPVTDGHVFTTEAGNPIARHDMGDRFKRLCVRANVGDRWVPRELRHSFVSAMSASGVPVERIAYLAGHSTSRTTELVYRRELKPVLREGGRAMGELTQGIAAPPHN